MDFEIRTATPAEQQYCYSQSTQIEGQAGCIGYLRADFGSGGDDFFASWFDSNREWKNPTFSNELDQLINTLRGFQTECLISGTTSQETFLVGRTELCQKAVLSVSDLSAHGQIQIPSENEH